MRYWRVEFNPDTGKVESVREIAQADGSVVYVEALDLATAERLAYRIYCRRKKKLAKERHRARGECASSPTVSPEGSSCPREPQCLARSV